MTVNIHKNNVEVKAEGCLPDSYQVVVRMDGKERFLTVPKGWCTVRPELIERGMMVWYRDGSECSRVGFYERPHTNPEYGHWVQQDRGGRVFAADHVRPVVEADLQRGKG